MGGVPSTIVVETLIDIDVPCVTSDDLEAWELSVATSVNVLVSVVSVLTLIVAS